VPFSHGIPLDKQQAQLLLTAFLHIFISASATRTQDSTAASTVITRISFIILSLCLIRTKARISCGSGGIVLSAEPHNRKKITLVKFLWF
jgi:hypothetical protein